MVSNMKNASCGLSLRVVTLNSTSNAIFEPIRTEGLLFTPDFFVQNFMVFRSIGLVAIPIAAFYVKKRFFAIFTTFSTVAPPVDLVETIGLRIRHP
jgi:hypothetical protein